MGFKKELGALPHAPATKIDRAEAPHCVCAPAPTLSIYVAVATPTLGEGQGFMREA